MLPKNIIWLASYPKSGNTWIRILISNYNSPSNKPISINEIDSSWISSSRVIFDEASAVLASDLTYEEIDNLRPEIYKALNSEHTGTVFIKTHDANTLNSNHEHIFPESITKGVIHIVRNPLDVAVSYAHHSNISIDKSMSLLNSENNCLAGNLKKLNLQLRQKLLSWSGHFESWENTKSPRLLIKYEDLTSDTFATFEKIIQFIYGEVDEKKLEIAIKNSSFEALKNQEQKYNFREKPLHAKSFFRKGQLNAWKEEMTAEQAEQIITKHKLLMSKLGYVQL